MKSENVFQDGWLLPALEEKFADARQRRAFFAQIRKSMALYPKEFRAGDWTTQTNTHVNLIGEEGKNAIKKYGKVLLPNSIPMKADDASKLLARLQKVKNINRSHPKNFAKMAFAIEPSPKGKPYGYSGSVSTGPKRGSGRTTQFQYTGGGQAISQAMSSGTRGSDLRTRAARLIKRGRKILKDRYVGSVTGIRNDDGQSPGLQLDLARYKFQGSKTTVRSYPQIRIGRRMI